MFLYLPIIVNVVIGDDPIESVEDNATVQYSLGDEWFNSEPPSKV